MALDAHTNDCLTEKRRSRSGSLKEPSAVSELTLWLVVENLTSLHLVASTLARSPGFPLPVSLCRPSDALARGERR